MDICRSGPQTLDKTSQYLNCLSSVVLPNFCLPAVCLVSYTLLISFSLFFFDVLNNAELWTKQGLIALENI